MKTTLYVADGVTQIVLTPETNLDRVALATVSPTSPHGEQDVTKATLYRGAFFECRGGWIREGGSESSVIIRVDL